MSLSRTAVSPDTFLGRSAGLLDRSENGRIQARGCLHQSWYTPIHDTGRGGRFSAAADGGEAIQKMNYAHIATLSLMMACTIRAQESDADAGERLFRLHCAECHGLDGQGGQGPDLTRGVYRRGSTDDALFRTISRGVPGTPMPATSLSDLALRQIVRHVRMLGGGVRVKVPGNA